MHFKQLLLVIGSGLCSIKKQIISLLLDIVVTAKAVDPKIPFAQIQEVRLIFCNLILRNLRIVLEGPFR